MEIDIHGEDYVPSAVPPAEVLAANKPKKPAKEGMLIRQKAKAAQSPAAALAPHNSADMEVQSILTRGVQYTQPCYENIVLGQQSVIPVTTHQ